MALYTVDERGIREYRDTGGEKKTGQHIPISYIIISNIVLMPKPK